MISIRVDDLAFVDADAIARPVDGRLRATTPVMRRLEQAAGPGLLRHTLVSDPLEVGAAVVTGGDALHAELLIHAVVSTDQEAVSRDGVRRATLSALQRAADWNVEHLALAPFGLGAGNLDPETSAAMMLEAIREHARRSPRPKHLTIIVETELEFESFTVAAGTLATLR
jgi:O-acetyl-ADP-ribose deacetylase (regulator of RNase III)